AAGTTARAARRQFLRPEAPRFHGRQRAGAADPAFHGARSRAIPRPGLPPRTGSPRSPAPAHGPPHRCARGPGRPSRRPPGLRRKMSRPTLMDYSHIKGLFIDIDDTIVRIKRGTAVAGESAPDTGSLLTVLQRAGVELGGLTAEETARRILRTKT